MTDGVDRREIVRALELKEDVVELHPPEPPTRKLFLNGTRITRS